MNDCCDSRSFQSLECMENGYTAMPYSTFYPTTSVPVLLTLLYYTIRTTYAIDT